MWRADKVIQRKLLATARAAARSIRSAKDRVPHRGDKGFGLGGSLANAITRAGFMLARAWGGVLRWSTLGQAGMFFHDGTPRQAARPFPTAPDVPELRAELQADAARYWRARAAAVGRAA